MCLVFKKILIVVPLSHPKCRLQGLFTAPVFPRRYCRLMRRMRHFSPAEVSSFPSADSLFKVQSAFLTKQKSRHIWKSCQLLCHGDPYPRLARYTSFHIYRLWAQSPVLRPSRPAAKTEGSAGSRRLQRWSHGGRCVGGNAPFFSLFSSVDLPTPIE